VPVGRPVASPIRRGPPHKPASPKTNPWPPHERGDGMGVLQFGGISAAGIFLRLGNSEGEGRVWAGPAALWRPVSGVGVSRMVGRGVVDAGTASAFTTS
jgi:hypothetical protein